MTANPDSLNFDNSVFSASYGIPFELTALSTSFDMRLYELLLIYELALMENPPDSQPTDLDERPQICASCSAVVSPPISPPSPQVATFLFLPPKWHQIPQRRYEQKQWDYSPVASILFPVNGYPGINMMDAFRKKFATLEGWEDPVLEDAGKTFSCRILFPGYPPNKSPQIFTRCWNKERDPITRGKLAYHIAKKLKEYLDSMSSSHIFDVSAGEQWKIGEGHVMHLENMFLAKLVSVTKGSFQPEIWVVDPKL